MTQFNDNFRKCIIILFLYCIITDKTYTLVGKIYVYGRLVAIQIQISHNVEYYA